MSHNGRHSHHDESITDLITDKVDTVVHNTERFLEKAGDEVKFQTEELNHKVHKYVRRNPYKALGLAALFGALMGLFIRR
jgi:ElaB/YqjD/DUF883 family membrane-anchored ribosome-binding protein